MNIGDKVQHFSTGSIGIVIDSSYEVDSAFQQMCVVWDDDLAPHKDSWERRGDLSVVSAGAYDFTIAD